MQDVAERRVLLLSSSRVHGQSYLEHAEATIRDFLQKGARVLFVPYALYDHDAYAEVACPRFRAMGYACESIHRSADPHRAVLEAEAVFVGGGNTFRLLKTMYDLQLLGLVRNRVREGMPYIGSSAGSNLACPTIRTTNDMPIVEPPSLQALCLVGFQLNPHYLDSDASSTHMGETREQRLREYLEENHVPVIGLREASLLKALGSQVSLLGPAAARVFRRGAEPKEMPSGSVFTDSLEI
ncbi:MAG: dipeptidase PepE [Candidatus Korobacteraceae bacterium]